MPGEQARATVDLLARRDELLEDRRLGTVTQLDDRPGHERPVRGPDRPAEDDRLVDLDAGRDPQDDAVAPAGAGQLREAVVLGQRARSGDQPFGRCILDEIGERFERHPGSGDAGIECERVHAILAERRQTGGPGIGLGHGVRHGLHSARSSVRDDVIEDRGPQVDVRRVQLVRLDRQRLEPGEGGASVGAQPGRLAGGQLLEAVCVELERELCGGSAGGTDA